MSGSGERPGPKRFEIPDLELPPANPRASQSALRAVVAPDSGKASVSGATSSPLRVENAFEAEVGFVALDLELDGPISLTTSTAHFVSGAQFSDDGFELDSVQAPPLPGLTVAPEGRANWPTGVTPSRETLALDLLEVRLLADYGATPAFGPLAVVYALRVALRQRALAARLRDLEKQLLLAERARDTLLAALAERALPELERSEAFRRVLEPLSEVQSLTNERGRALSATSAEHAAELGRLDAEISTESAELARERAASAELAGLLAAREHTFQRVEARHKRCFIEMRAIEQQAAQRVGPAGGEMPAELFAKLAPLQAQVEALRPELEQARTAYESTRAELELRGRQQKQREQKALDLERKKRQVGERYRPVLSARQQGLGEAAAHRRNLLADVGRSVLATRGGVSVDEPTLEGLRQADSQVSALVKQSELHLRALDASDRDKVKSGFTWLALAAVALCAYVASRIYG